jgi:hypothetical protein
MLVFLSECLLWLARCLPASVEIGREVFSVSSPSTMLSVVTVNIDVGRSS